MGTDETIHGGKGDDKINVVGPLYYTDPEFTTLETASNIFAFAPQNTGTVVHKGGEGDDEIWANASASGSLAKYYGGNGDDILKGAL